MKNGMKTLMMVASLCTCAGLTHAQEPGMNKGADSAGMSRSDMRQKNAAMLLHTLSEEKTEINSLAGQQARFKAMGDRESQRIARMWGKWIREHKAGGPTLMRLTRANGGDPMQAKIMKPPPLGSKMQMLMATHKDHMHAVMTSQMRFGMTNSPAIKRAMHKRANLARKHIRQMQPFMDGMSGHGAMSSGHAMSNDGAMSRGSAGHGDMDRGVNTNSTTGSEGPRMDGGNRAEPEGTSSTPDGSNKGAR